VWSYVLQAGASDLPGAERVSEGTSAVTPWPHQQRAFQRLWQQWPPRLLIADEVGLGKTVQAGLLLRQAWLSGRARRMLVMAPASVLKQWQRELREKFGPDWPNYSGKSPCARKAVHPVCRIHQGESIAPAIRPARRPGSEHHACLPSHAKAQRGSQGG